jgi:predicted O-methyltransferase YrrM
MTPAEIRAVVGNLPHTSHARGEELYRFIQEHRLTRCLELGFQHGVGTTWMAGAIQSLGSNGKVVAVDLLNKKQPIPSAFDLTNSAGLSSFVELYEDPISYTWHLKRNLDRYAKEPFDFIFIDGAHRWDTDGFAFFLADRVLKQGGWILFDDLDWTFASSSSIGSSAPVRAMTPEERDFPQVRAVWEQLVLTHPSYGNFIEEGGWGWAQKLLSPEVRRLEIVKRTSLLPKQIRKILRRR